MFSSCAQFYVGVRPANAKSCYAAIQRLNGATGSWSRRSSSGV